MRTAAIVTAICPFILGLTAVASYLTTCMVWDGGFLSGEIRIDIRDPQGQPISGAVLHVYRARTRQLALKYPLANHDSATGLASDAGGRIIAVQERDGLQFGGRCWHLFWIIPMGRCSRPYYDCELSAPGYHATKFEVWRLFDSPHAMYDEFPKTTRQINGEQQTLKVYEQKFVLTPVSPP